MMKDMWNLKPDLKTFKSLAKKYSLVPTYKELPADLETPVTAYLKLSYSNPYGALLESVEGGEKLGRYSFISISHHFRFESRGTDVYITGRGQTIKKKNAAPLGELKEFFEKLKPATLPELPRFCGGAVGMIGYDMVRNFEKLPDHLPGDIPIPDSLFLFSDECVVFDHWKQKMIFIKWNLIDERGRSGIRHVYADGERSIDSLIRKLRNHKIQYGSNIKKTPSPAHISVRSNITAAKYRQMVLKAKEYIREGDIIQTVLSQRFTIDSNVDPFDAYRALRMINPSPYLYLIKLGDSYIVGSSPEILVRKEGRTALTRPIAGTRRRGATESEDIKLENELLNDPKEKAEHLMLVDLGRNDLGRCCKAGSVKVPDFMKVEKYSHVMHLVSTVEGILKEKEDAFSLFKACFPAGTVSGAPKIRAMEIIEELEAVRRNIYAGSVGYFSYSGNMDMAITIRTLLFCGGKVHIQAGAGIVADSVPNREEKETRSKAAALIHAVNLAQKGLK